MRVGKSSLDAQKKECEGLHWTQLDDMFLETHLQPFGYRLGGLSPSGGGLFSTEEGTIV
jgi:hypothetical protein